MQVNHAPFDVTTNMILGVAMLRDLYVRLGSAKAAVLAYNSGLGGYLKGNYKIQYWEKFQKAKRRFENEKQQDQDFTPEEYLRSKSFTNNLVSSPGQCNGGGCSAVGDASRCICESQVGRSGEGSFLAWGRTSYDSTAAEVQSNLGEVTRFLATKGDSNVHIHYGRGVCLASGVVCGATSLGELY